MSQNTAPSAQPLHTQPQATGNALVGQESPGIGIVTADAELSPSEKFLREFRERRGPVLQPLRIELGDDFTFECQVKTLSDNDLTEIGCLMAAKGFSLSLPMASLEALSTFYAAFMFVAVMESDDDDARYFESMDAAAEWQKLEGLAEVVNQLRGVLVVKNPFVQANLLGIGKAVKKTQSTL